MAYTILTINPGSTSTKIAIFRDEQEVYSQTIRHSAHEINQFPSIASQFLFRKELILEDLKKSGILLSEIDIIVGRGGLVRPIESGIYEVNKRLLEDLHNPVMGEHASNLGGLIADDLAKDLKNGVKAYIADPVVVDELQSEARLSGHPAIKRVSIFHALNQKAIARLYAKENNRKYEELNLIVAHLGGGISVSAHKEGYVIDTNNALNGDGPFSPERTGGLPVGSLAEICFGKDISSKEVKKMICGKGGLVAYLGTNNVGEVVEKAEKDLKWKLVLDAMCYQISKEIGAMAVVLEGDIDAIILTGGIAHNKYVTDYIKNKTEFLASVKVYPGEDEMRALALNGLMILKEEIEPKIY